MRLGRGWVPWLIVAVSGLLGALSGCRPTGSGAVDRPLCLLVAAAVTFLGGRAPSWALIVGAGVAAAATSNGSIAIMVAAWLVLLLPIAAAWRRVDSVAVSTIAAAGVVQVSMRLTWNPFLGASALVGVAACALVGVAGLARQTRRTRRVSLRVGLGVLGFVVVAFGGLAAAGAQARTGAVDGYRQLVDGLQLVRSGNLDEAAASLRAASDNLARAADDLDRPWARMSAALPMVAQNRDAAARLMATAARTSSAAAALLDEVDLQALQLSGGAIDVAAIQAAVEPLARLDATIADLQHTLVDTDSPWLVRPLDRRLSEARRRAVDVGQQATTAALAAREAPAMLGADGPRRYLLTFGTPAEARGSSGLLGNWSELTIDAGRLSLTGSGRVSDLMALTEQTPFGIDASDDFFDRYDNVGLGKRGGVITPSFWQNVTMSPDMPSVGAAVAQMYRGATGRDVDGVLIIDPAAIAALLDVTGPIQVPERDAPLDSSNVEQFLLLDQYQLDTDSRADLLASVTTATVARLLTGTLPPPQELAAKLGPAALGGHMSMYAVRAEEEAMLAAIGMDASLPQLVGAYAGADGLAVVTQNAGGNKLDAFLQRTLSYDATYDDTSGTVRSTLAVHLANSAPTSGYPPYVISNLVGIRDGTNRMILSVYSPLAVDRVLVGDVPTKFGVDRELGYFVYSLVVDVPSKSEVDVRFELSGVVARGGYRLVYRPQALPHADEVAISALDEQGTPLVAFDGTLSRRSVLADGAVKPWRG